MKLSQFNARLDEGILFEGGMSRVLTHHKGPFAVLTAFRANYSLAVNRARNRKLEERLRSIGAGGLKVIGHWLEAPDGVWYGRDYGEINPDELTDTTEEAYFVPIPKHVEFDDFRAWVVLTIVGFNQDAAVLSDGQSICLIDKANRLTPIGSGVSVGKIAQAYSTIKAKKPPEGSSQRSGIDFVFEGTMRPSGIYHKMLLQRRGVFWV